MSNAVLSHLGRAYVGLILFFLYAPILVMAAMSFNASEFYQLPFSFTTDWYAKLAGNREILSAAWRSVWIAVIVTAIATSLGTAASIALFRYDFPGKRVLQVLLFPPIAIPWLITGTAMLIFFFGIGLGRGTPAVILGHVALALP
jgi:spermidine/putrescine transport system permease protein